MKPAKFDYSAPGEVAEALSLLRQFGNDAKILAGGQSLVPILNFRMGQYDHIIDINRIGELSYIRLDNEVLCIGSTTRQRSIEISDLVSTHSPLLAYATKHVAHLPIRTRGTLGGSLAHADPSAEDPAVMLALDAEMVISSEDHTRKVKASSFFEGPMETTIRPEELLVEIRLPIRRPGEGFAFEEVSRRKGDFALVGVATSIALDRNVISRARIASCGMEAGAMRMRAAEDMLSGSEVSPHLILEAAAAASAEAVAQNDIHATAGYRRHLVKILTQRTLNAAIDRARVAI